jgi:hypothetical protein
MLYAIWRQADTKLNGYSGLLARRPARFFEMSTAHYFLKIFLDPLIIVLNNGYFFDMLNSALLPAGIPFLPQNW